MWIFRKNPCLRRFSGEKWSKALKSHHCLSLEILRKDGDDHFFDSFSGSEKPRASWSALGFDRFSER